MTQYIFHNFSFPGYNRIITACMALIVLLITNNHPFSAEPSSSEKQAIEFADGLYQREMYESAAQQYADFLSNYPASSYRPTAVFRRGESLYQHAIKINKNKPLEAKIFLVEARGAFQDFINENPGSERLNEALIRHGEISYKIGDAKGGLQSLNRIIKESKDKSLVEAALFYSGRCYENLEQYKEAQKRYRQIRDTFPKGEYAGLATYLLAEVFQKTDQTEKAAELLADLWNNPSKYSIPEGSTLIEDSKLLSAQILYQQDKFAEAAKAYEAYIEKNPNSPNTAKAKYGAAWSEYRQQNYGKALAIADSLQRQSLPGDLAVGIIFMQGTCSYQQKMYIDAIAYFRDVIADPNAGEYRERAWYQLAWSYYLSDDYNKALEECKRFTQHGGNPTMISNVHFLMAQCYAHLDNYDSAIKELKLSRKIDAQGDYAEEALYLTADLLYRQKNYTEAADTFESFFETYPSSSRAQQALLWACNARFANKDYQKAIETADRLLETFPNLDSKQEMLYRKGLALYKLENLDEALNTFNQLIEETDADKRKPDAFYWQGYIYEIKEQREKASQMYGKLLENYPNFKNRDEVLLRKSLCDYQRKARELAYDGFKQVLDTQYGTKIPAEVIFWMIFYADEEGKHKEALSIVERVLNTFDQPSLLERAYIAKGNQLVALERWKEASINAETFLKQYPNSMFKPEIYWSQAKALEGLDLPIKALDIYEKSLTELTRLGDPDPTFAAELYLDRGRLLAKRQRFKSALDSFLRVAIIYDHPQFTPEAMYQAVKCHLELKDKKSAQTMYNELLDRFPKSDWRKKAIQEFVELSKDERVSTP